MEIKSKLFKVEIGKHSASIMKGSVVLVIFPYGATDTMWFDAIWELPLKEKLELVKVSGEVYGQIRELKHG